MAVKRIPIMVTKHGGRDNYDRPLSVDREMWVDVPVKPEVPPGTPKFESVKEDVMVQEAERRWQHLIETGPKAEEAVTDAYNAYQQTLNAYAYGTASMEQVEAAQALHMKAIAMRDALKRSLAPVRSAVVVARKQAIEEGRQAFQKEVTPLFEERSQLLARLQELDSWYQDTVHSFRLTDNPYARYLPTRMDGKASVSAGNAVEDSIARFVNEGLTLPDEGTQEQVPRKVLESWRVER